jgi:hypothetical protein
MTLRHIVAPLAKRGLIGTWIIAYIFCSRDLGTLWWFIRLALTLCRSVS